MGKPSKGTPADKRLKENQPKAVAPKPKPASAQPPPPRPMPTHKPTGGK